MLRQDQIPAASLNFRNLKNGERPSESLSFSDNFTMFRAPYESKGKWLNCANFSEGAEPFYGRLRLHFECIATEPMPDRLATLTDQLQAALDRGDLFTNRRCGQ